MTEYSSKPTYCPICGQILLETTASQPARFDISTGTTDSSPLALDYLHCPDNHTRFVYGPSDAGGSNVWKSL